MAAVWVKATVAAGRSTEGGIILSQSSSAEPGDIRPVAGMKSDRDSQSSGSEAHNERDGGVMVMGDAQCQRQMPASSQR
jgi:hypothetical protein